MAGRIAVTLAVALASVFAQAKHIKVPLTLHTGNKPGSGAHINHAIAKFKGTGVVIEPETFALNEFWYGSFDVGDSKNLSLAIDTGSSYLGEWM